NQQWANIRIPALLETPAAVRWVSAEPLLGPVDLSPWLDCLDWVVVGGESGPGARPMAEEWAAALVEQCQRAGVPVFFKQAGTVLAQEWGCTHSKGGDPSEWSRPWPRQYPDAVREYGDTPKEEKAT